VVESICVQCQHQRRIPTLLEDSRLSHDIGLPGIDPKHDRFMLWGSPGMLADTLAVLEKFDLAEGNMSRPGRYVIERAFVGE
jgi:ferredoxin--NADP+ reductase